MPVYSRHSRLLVLQLSTRTAAVCLCNSYVLLLAIHACLLVPQSSTRAALCPCYSCLPVLQLCTRLWPCMPMCSFCSPVLELQLSAHAAAVYHCYSQVLLLALYARMPVCPLCSRLPVLPRLTRDTAVCSPWPSAVIGLLCPPLAHHLRPSSFSTSLLVPRLCPCARSTALYRCCCCLPILRLCAHLRRACLCARSVVFILFYFFFFSFFFLLTRIPKAMGSCLLDL
jgi:hypothetical protein